MCGSRLNCQTLCLGARPRYSLVVDEDVKKSTNSSSSLSSHFFRASWKVTGICWRAKCHVTSCSSSARSDSRWERTSSCWWRAARSSGTCSMARTAPSPRLLSQIYLGTAFGRCWGLFINVWSFQCFTIHQYYWLYLKKDAKQSTNWRGFCIVIFIWI